MNAHPDILQVAKEEYLQRSDVDYLIEEINETSSNTVLNSDLN